jgi:lysosomal acid lipase/cholesteryl ester hydrolase
MDEMARYDVPAIVDYVTTYTGAAKIGYIGFSQGTAQGFAALSTQPRTAARVSAFAALGPAVTVRGTT